MPGSTPLPPDLRSYRPAAVLVIDLVKHSTRDQPTTMAIQGAITDALSSALSTLRLRDAHFNHTGDGYVCSFLGDDSARVIDFINVLYPHLQRSLSEHNQHLRGGLAFGLLHLRSNTLTKTNTHFDLPGIEAARLEQAAPLDKILCTPTVHSIFRRHYPAIFSAEPVEVLAKDRALLAFELIPSQVWDVNIRQRILDFIFSRRSVDGEERDGALLLIDDHDDNRDALAEVLKRSFPQRAVLLAATGEDGIRAAKREQCAVILTDIVMPGMSGVEVVQRIRSEAPQQLVIGLSAYASESLQTQFFQAGGFRFYAKPIMPPKLKQAVDHALSQSAGEDLRETLGLMCDDVGALWYELHEVGSRWQAILDSVGDGRDFAQEMLRHKAKHIVNEGVNRLGPGVEPVDVMRTINVQLACIERLGRIVGGLGLQKLSGFICTLVEDLRHIHPHIEFVYEDHLDSPASGDVSFGGVVVLAIAELLDNAVAAADKNGRITISLSTLHAARTLQISVKDNGPGVPSELESRMFDEGFSTNGVGRGLGLHLVREAVRVLRGQVMYSSRNGSEFRVSLPLSHEL